MIFPLTCVVLSGGKSSRMGENKAFLAFRGFSSLIEYQYTRLGALFNQVVISTKLSISFSFPAQVIYDCDELLFAPIEGLYTVLHTLQEERLMVLGVDMPLVDTTVFGRLMAHDREDLDAVIVRTRTRTHPLCGIYHRSILPHVLAMKQEGNYRLHHLLERIHVEYVMLEEETLLANLNTPSEYRRVCH